MVFAISISFASLIMRISKDESAVFHFYADSSVGKSLLEIVASSVHENMDRNRLPHWDVTATGLEEIAADHCDRLMVLDEAARLSADPRIAAAKARESSFKLAAGLGRLRSRHYGNDGNLCRWLLFVVSSGEEAISELANKAGKKRLRGDLVRMIDIPATAHPDFGIFDRLPKGYVSGRPLAIRIEDGCRNFGHPAAKMLRRVIADGDELVRSYIERAKRRFIKAAAISDDKWEQRYAQRFALAYAAASLAIRYDVLPWKRRNALKAIVTVYRTARGALARSDDAVVTAVDKLKERLMSSVGLIDLRGKHQAEMGKLANAEGFIKKDPKLGTYYAVKAAVLETCGAPNADKREIAALLNADGHLIVSKRGIATRQVLVPGIPSKQRYYCVRRSFLKKGRQAGKSRRSS